MGSLFYRTGEAFVGTPRQDADGQPFVTRPRACGRCGGMGGNDAWKHTGWTCYQCAGKCVIGETLLKLYTVEQLAKLNLALQRRQATAVKRRAEKSAAEKAEADARRAAFEIEFSDVLPWLHEVGVDEDGHVRESFLGNMLHQADRHATFSESQAAAVRASLARAVERQRLRESSRHVGVVGARVTLTCTVERVLSYERACFNAAWRTEEVHVVSMRTLTGDAVCVKSTGFYREKGARVDIVGTIKELTEYRGEKQTTLQRVRVTATRDAVLEEAAA